MKWWLFLFIWVVIGVGLRLTLLESKPPWTDEFSTIVFSLGNSFRTVPLDRAITLDVLLQPLQPNPNAGIADVLKHLFTETNHPPLYFILSHCWMKLFSPSSNGLASVWAARALSALFGALSIPAIYGISWLAFRSQLVSQLAAAMMTVSPYGIFIAQEARHYTLAILWVIASLSCLVIATKHIQRWIPIPAWLVLLWICINGIGIATHYFFALTFGTEIIWLIFLAWRQFKGKFSVSLNQKQRVSYFPWWQILVVIISTMIEGLLWLPLFLQANRGGELTDWIQSGDRGLLEWISPIFQALVTLISMLYLLPVSASSLVVVIISGLAMLGFFIWVLPILKHGIVRQIEQPTSSLMAQLFSMVVIGGISLFFFFTYALEIDLTRGARYYFVYFPAVIVLLGASLAICWHTPNNKQNFFPSSGRTAVSIILSMGMVSALVVVCNLGYPKYYRPDLLVPLIQQVSQSPVLIATTHKTHVQTGEMMGLARVLKIQSSLSPSPLFLLAHQNQKPEISTTTLQNTLSQLPRPLDLWLVNFHAPVQLNNCIADNQSFPPVYGYEYQIYHCQETTNF
ncbi:hypothetical protein NUACC21_41420 [Scytonema sp. NUACC21]